MSMPKEHHNPDQGLSREIAEFCHYHGIIQPLTHSRNRFYTTDHLKTLRAILHFRDADLSFDQIADLLVTPAPQLIQEALEKGLDTLSTRIERLQHQHQDLQHLLANPEALDNLATLLVGNPLQGKPPEDPDR